MADLYKEYEAHVPGKWESFAKGAIPPKPGAKSFAHCLPQGAAALAQRKQEIEEAEAANDQRRLGGKKGGLGHGERWISEMQKVIEEDRQRAETQRRAAVLDDVLAKKHRAYMARRERELLPPELKATEEELHVSLDSDGCEVIRSVKVTKSKPMPARYYAVAESHPAEVARYKAMLSAASDVDLRAAKERIEEHAVAQQTKREVAAAQHLAKVDAQAKRAEEERRLNALEAKTFHDSKLQKSVQRRREKSDEAAEALELATEAAEERRARTTQRLAEERADRERQARQRAKEAEHKLESMAAMKAEKQDTFEQRMEQQQRLADERRAVAEARRHHKVEQKLGDHAYARAMERRDEFRQKQIETGRLGEQTREKRMVLAAEARHEELLDLKQTHSRRRERVESRLDEIAEDRAEAREELTERAHEPRRDFSPVPRRTPVYLSTSPALRRSASVFGAASMNQASSVVKRSKSTMPLDNIDKDSLTLQRLAHAQHNLATKNARDEAARSRARAAQNERDSQVAAVQAKDHQATTRRQRELESRRIEVRASAADREEDRQRKVDEDAAKREAHSEKQLELLRRQRQEDSSVKSTAKQQRILACLDEVNVVKREELIENMETRRKRRTEFEAAEAARKAASDKAKAEARRAVDARIEGQVRDEEQRREREAARRRKDHNERVGNAVATRDLSLRAQQQKLQQADRRRREKAEVASQASIERNRTLAANVAKADEAQRLAVEQAKEDYARELKQRSKQERARAEQALERNSELQAEKREATEKKLDYVRERAHSSLDVRRQGIQEVVREARAHAHTPAPAAPRALSQPRKRGLYTADANPYL